MGRNRIYEEARKQSGVDRGWGGEGEGNGNFHGFDARPFITRTCGDTSWVDKDWSMIADGGTSLGNFFDRVKL